MGMNFRAYVCKRVPENDIFWSEIRSGFGDHSHAPPRKIPRRPETDTSENNKKMSRGVYLMLFM